MDQRGYNLGGGNHSREALRGGRSAVSAVSASYTPPDINFPHNSNTNYHMHCNGLTAAMESSATAAPISAAASALAATMMVSMVKRVMKTVLGF